MKLNSANKGNKGNKSEESEARKEARKLAKKIVKYIKKEFPLVDFCDIDTNLITFGTPKKNNYNGTQIPILYNGKSMNVKYSGVIQFGIRRNYDLNGNDLGTSMQINLHGAYLMKAKELDEFFIDAFYKNKWSLAKSIPKSNIEGYDEHGQGGLWKRICKKSYKVDKKTKEREYLDYPSKMEFSLFYKNDDLQTTFFDGDKNKIDDYTEIGPWSDVKFIAAWFSLCRGTFGLTLKPKLMQVKYKPEESIFDDCLIAESYSEGEKEDDDKESDKEEDEEEPIKLDYNRFDLHN